MSRVYAVALNTFREAVRDRILQGILVVGALGLLFVLVLAELALDQRQRLI